MQCQTSKIRKNYFFNKFNVKTTYKFVMYWVFQELIFNTIVKCKFTGILNKCDIKQLKYPTDVILRYRAIISEDCQLVKC